MLYVEAVSIYIEVAVFSVNESRGGCHPVHCIGLHVPHTYPEGESFNVRASTYDMANFWHI
jgi:hypothetical protein